MMYKEGEKVRYIGESYPDLQNALFYVDEIDIEDSHLPLKIESETGIMSVWVSYEDVELIKVGVDHADTDKQNESVSGHLFRVESKIDELAEALKMIDEKIDKMNKGKDVEVTFDKDELVIKPKFKEKIEAIWDKPSTMPPSTAKLHTGEVIVPHSSSYRTWTPKTKNEMRKELIEEAKKKVELTVERREKHLYENINFHVNPAKRVVVCIIKEDDGEIIGKGIAKCAPEDVFNRHLGKFIALRRACGVTNFEMESKFLDPVQPDKLVKGMRITPRNQNLNSPYVHVEVVERVEDEKAWVSSYAYAPIWANEVNEKFYISDTNAEY